ncbi:LCP family protein [Streptomyces sp. NPDC052682]|uniref:LCP family protein n=1 Tax=Streptomyces sp. NPDC052682 TaxID=3154954 RepID=UPI00341E4C69
MTRNSVHGEGTRPGAVPRQPGPGGRRARDGEGAGPGGDGAGRTGGARARRGRPRPGRGRRVLRWSATGLAVLVLGTAGAGYLYYRHLNGNLEKGQRSSGDSTVRRAEPNAAGQTPLNILLIGSDSRNSAENLKLGGSRDNVGSKPLADVQMLIHLSADRRSAAMVSIPRDTRVDIPECKDPDSGETYPAKNTLINESLQRGGPGCTLATWQNLTGVYIDHWMMVDFAGVVSMADAVGGVPVCVNQNVWDRPLPGQRGGSGLKLTAGTHKVRGERALQWLRTRHAWGSDPLRAKAQHLYMNAMIRTLKQQNVFTDTGRLMDLAEAATKSLKVSEEIGSVKELYDLGMQLKSVPTDRITMTTMPWIEDPEDHNHLLPKSQDADRVWAMLRDDVPFDRKGSAKTSAKGKAPGAKKQADGKEAASEDPAAPDAEIGVLVRNATRTATLGPVTGRAGALARLLAQKGFAKAAADTSAALSQERTTVLYPSTELAGDARRVAEALGIPAGSVRRSTDVSGVTLVVGADWRAGTAYPKQPAPRAGDIPQSADAVNGSDSGQCMNVYAPYRW